MKNKIIKRALSLVLVLIMVLSATVMAIPSVCAADNSNTIEYTLKLITTGGKGPTTDDIWVNINGAKASTGWVNLGDAIYKNIFAYYACTYVTFNAPDVGKVVSIDTKVDGTDGWYPESISVWMGNEEHGLYFPCGKWVDNGEVVNFSHDTKSYLLTVKTADVKNAGTDRNVYATLVDVNGVCSEKTNLSELVEDLNTFEKGDTHSVMIHTPEGFGKLDHIKFELEGGSAIAGGWKLESVSVDIWTHISEGESFHMSKTVNQWGDKGEPITVKF